LRVAIVYRESTNCHHRLEETGMSASQSCRRVDDKSKYWKFILKITFTIAHYVKASIMTTI